MNSDEEKYILYTRY